MFATLCGIDDLSMNFGPPDDRNVSQHSVLARVTVMYRAHT